MSKEIWLPQTTVKVKMYPNGYVETWDEIVMKPKPIKEKTFGFKLEEKEKDGNN